MFHNANKQKNNKKLHRLIKSVRNKKKKKPLDPAANESGRCGKDKVIPRSNDLWPAANVYKSAR